MNCYKAFKLIIIFSDTKDVSESTHSMPGPSVTAIPQIPQHPSIRLLEENGFEPQVCFRLVFVVVLNEANFLYKPL